MSKPEQQTISHLYQTIKSQVGSGTRYRSMEQMAAEHLKKDGGSAPLAEVADSFASQLDLMFLANTLGAASQQINSEQIKNAPSLYWFEAFGNLERLAAHSKKQLSELSEREQILIQSQIVMLVGVLAMYEQSINHAQDIPELKTR